MIAEHGIIGGNLIDDPRRWWNTPGVADTEDESMSEHQSTCSLRSCGYCHEPFRPKYSTQEYCSAVCWNRQQGSASVLDRFWANVDRSGGEDACWLWTGNLFAVSGYGRFFYTRQGIRHTERAHRFSYTLAHGAIPDGVEVCHSCDARYPVRSIEYRRCVNPSHLFLGTRAENAADMVAKGRQIRGVDAPKAKLVPWKVRAIRAAYVPGEVTLEELGELFGVGKGNVKNIVDRETWRWLP